MTPSSSLRADTLRHIDEVLARCPSLDGLRAELVRTVEAVCACHRAGGKILVCGNGGSAADSEHIVGELVKGFVLPRAVPAADAERLRAADDFGDHLAEKLQRGVAAVSLTGHPSLAPAIDNDTGRDMVFAQRHPHRTEHQRQLRQRAPRADGCPGLRAPYRRVHGQQGLPDGRPL